MKMRGGIARWSREGVSLTGYAAGVSLWTMGAFNIPFFHYVLSATDITGGTRWVLIASLVLVLLLIHFLLIDLLVATTRMVGRVLLAVLNGLSALCTYFVVRYHALMDGTMMANVLHTRMSEADGFLTGPLLGWMIVLGLLPAIVIIAYPVRYERRLSTASVLSVLAALVVLIAANLPQTRWFGRHDAVLGGLIMPWSYIVNTGRVIAQEQAAQRQETPLPDATIQDETPSSVVLVIGESSRRANWQLYGYPRPTNPHLSLIPDLQVYRARAAATYTTAGLRAILSAFPSHTLYEILPNYLYRQGVDVVWRTSNWGEPPVHIPAYHTRQQLAEEWGIRPPLYDEILFRGIDTLISACPSKRQLIVLHTSTSHGPDYHNQYPPDYAWGDANDIVDAYDNTIRYTDSLLAELIDRLRLLAREESFVRRLAIIYISDHGESLGEKGCYMHGLPLAIAPPEQVEIPMVVWTSDGRRVWMDENENEDEVEQYAVFGMVVRLLGMRGIGE